MNTIDVTTITHVKFENQQFPWKSEPVDIKPDSGIDLRQRLNMLFKARYVRVRDEWIKLGASDPGLSFPGNPDLFVKDGTEKGIQLPGDPAKVSYLQMWGFYFPEGEYLFDNVILQDKIYLLGAGAKTVFKSYALQTLLGQAVKYKHQYAAIKPILTQTAGEHLTSAIIENITFEDCKFMELNTLDEVIRNCRFYNMLGGLGNFSKNRHLLIENNYLGFKPWNGENGAYTYLELSDTPQGTEISLLRDPAISCTGMGIYAEAIAGVGQHHIVIQNNYIENTGDNGFAVRGLVADHATSEAASGIGYVRITGNTIINSSKAEIKLTYENGGGGHHLLPFGQFMCHVIDNQIREWAYRRSEAAISCDNDAVFGSYEVCAWPVDDSDPYRAGIPLQEIVLPPLIPDISEIDHGYNAEEEAATGQQRAAIICQYSYSTGLVVQGNIIMGSGRAFPEGEVFTSFPNGVSQPTNEVFGITLRKWKNAIINNNVITGIPIYNSAGRHYPSGSVTRVGIHLHDCHDFTINCNSVMNANYVLVFETISDIEYDNNIKGAIRLINCHNGTIDGNVLKNPGAAFNDGGRHESNGIVLWNTRYCIISGNVIGCYNPKHLGDAATNIAVNSYVTLKHGVVEVQFNNSFAEFTYSAENTIGKNKVYNNSGAAYNLFDASATGGNHPRDVYYGSINYSEEV